MNNVQRHGLLSQAVWLKENNATLNKGEVFHYITEIDTLGEFSVRQLSNICNNKISASTLRRYLVDKPRHGGRLNTGSLRELLDLFKESELGVVDYRVVKRIMNAGTSQNVVARLTGISQSSISRNTRV
jgi:hypothetical protein